MKSLQQHINERLVLSKNKPQPQQCKTPEEFYDALKSYKGKYSLGEKGTFMLDEYCEDNNIEKFICIDEYEDNFTANLLRFRRVKGNPCVEVLGEDWHGSTLSCKFTDFNQFVKGFLSRWYGKKSDPVAGEKHLQNIYNILIRN